MRYLSFFTLLLLFGAYSDGECMFGPLQRVYNKFMGVSNPESEGRYPSLVLGMDNKRFCAIANFPIVVSIKDENFIDYFFVCPSKTNKEKQLNEQLSRTKNTLFIRDSEGITNLNDNNKEKKKSPEEDKTPPMNFNNEEFEYIEYDCPAPVMPSIITTRTEHTDQLEITANLVGFEIYVDEKYKNLTFSKYMDLHKGFQWVNALIIRFDRRHLNVLSVNSEIYRDVVSFLVPKFQNVEDERKELGKEFFYNSVQIDSFYTLEYQEKLFHNLFKDTALKEKYFHKIQKRYLVETYLAPLDSFVTPALQKAALTYGNIAPMWKIIRDNSWSTIEKHIKNLVQALFGVYSITGTYGTLELSGKKIHLGPFETVRVPLAFWKIVMYPLSVTEFHNIIIVTVNNPYENVSDGLCLTSQCKEFGWQHLEQDFYPLGRTLCCPLTNDILAKLHISDNGLVKVGHVLNLKAVPHWENNRLTLNVIQYIMDREKRLRYNPEMRVDHMDYRNEKYIELNSDKKKKNDDKKKDVDDFSLSKFALTLFKDYLAPGVASLAIKTKDYVTGTSQTSPIPENDLKQPLMNEQQDDSEVKDTPNDQKIVSEEGKYVPSDQHSDIDGKDLQKDHNTENNIKEEKHNDELEKSSSNDQKSDN